MLQRVLICSFICAALLGCSSTIDVVVPDPRLPPFLSNDAVMGNVGNQGHGWQEIFTDEKLKAIISLALSSNKTLLLSDLQIARARIAHRREQSRRVPSIYITSGASLSTGNGQAQGGSLLLEATKWELDFYNNSLRSTEAASAEILASEASRKAAEILIVSEVAENWVLLNSNSRRLDLAFKTLESRKEGLNTIQNRVNIGISSHLELVQLQTSVEAAQYDVLKFTVERKNSLETLKLLIGDPRQLDLVLPTAGEAMSIGLIQLPENIDSKFILQRPDIIAAEQRLLAARLSVHKARAALLPKVSFNANAGFSNADINSFFRSGLALNFLPTISIPLLNINELEANADDADITNRIAIIGYERSLLDAFIEISKALNARSEVLRRIESKKKLLGAAARRNTLADERYQRGISTHLELFDAQRSLYSAQQGEIDEEVSDYLNRIDIYKALGGGATPSQDHE